MPHRATLAYLLLLLAFVPAGQAVFSLPYQLRFVLPVLNYWGAAALALAIPVAAYFVLKRLPWLMVQVLGFVVLAGFLLAGLFFAASAIMVAPAISSSVDPEHQLVHEVRDGRGQLRLYSVSCGVPCSSGLDLRKEWDVGFGMKLVSPLWSQDGAVRGQLVASDERIWVKDGLDVLGEIAR